MRKMLVLLCVVVMSSIGFGAEPTEIASTLGIWTLVPPLIAIGLAFITKNVVLSLFIGIYSGSFLLGVGQGRDYVFSFIGGFSDITNRIIGSMADSWNAGIILQCLTIGGLVALITKMGGAKAVAESLAKRAKTPRSAQLITWIMGIFIFFDDYANALIVGPIMRPITDKMRISREKLAFIIDSTAAPVAGVALISTWIGYEISVIKDGYSIIGLDNINAYSIFVQTIPYRFYNILMLVFVVSTGYFLREFGPMAKAEKRARTTGEVATGRSAKINNEEAKALAPKEGVKLSIWNAVIPIMVLILGSFIGFYINGKSTLDNQTLEIINNTPYSFYSIRETFGAADASLVIFQAALFASIIAIVMGVNKKIFEFSEAIDTWIHGMKSLVITGIILLLAWSLTSVIKDLGTSTYLVNILAGSIPKILLPSIIFLLGSIIAFSTGSSFGTMGILMPLAIPLSSAIGNLAGLTGEELISYIVASVGAVHTLAIFGDH
jgi:Na+/H+ antiporter NhaC